MPAALATDLASTVSCLACRCVRLCTRLFRLPASIGWETSPAGDLRVALTDLLHVLHLVHLGAV